MDYKTIYNNLITSRKSLVKQNGIYYEKHHIIPKSLGGNNSKENLVFLTGREHFIAHLLLHKIFNSPKTLQAILMMQCKSYCNDRRPNIKNSRMYQWARQEFSKYQKIRQSGSLNSQYGSKWICNIILRKNKKIRPEELIPDGWQLGVNLWVEKPPKKKIPREKNGRTAKQNLRDKQSRRRYLIEGVEFLGLKNICEVYNLTHPAVIYRLRSPKFPDWKTMGE